MFEFDFIPTDIEIEKFNYKTVFYDINLQIKNQLLKQVFENPNPEIELWQIQFPCTDKIIRCLEFYKESLPDYKIENDYIIFMINEENIINKSILDDKVFTSFKNIIKIINEKKYLSLINKSLKRSIKSILHNKYINRPQIPFRIDDAFKHETSLLCKDAMLIFWDYIFDEIKLIFSKDKRIINLIKYPDGFSLFINLEY